MKKAEKYIIDYAKDFIENNFDKINYNNKGVKYSIPNNKEKLLKELDIFDNAMWVITELMWWGMDKDYFTPLDVDFFDKENANFKVIKLNDEYIKYVFHFNTGDYYVSFAKPEYKKILTFK